VIRQATPVLITNFRNSLTLPAFTFTHTYKLMQLATAGLLYIRNRKLLLAYSRNKQCFYLPGGKVDAGETSLEALSREVSEELNIQIAATDVHFYTHITAPAFGEQNGLIMEQDCFLLQKEINPIASAEIGELDFFSLEEYLRQKNQAPGAVMILQQLKKDGLID
jgi:8-oxo-dGTP pyrophosphatase MutT (NUDIX family)